MKAIQAAFLLLAAWLAGRPASAQVMRAAVTGGQVEGVVEAGVASFKGVPFAAPPLGADRWRAPQPVRPWRGVKRAVAFGPACMQDQNTLSAMAGAALPVSEDCLYLNVWTPAHSGAERLPVMVWIYGGAFTGGATSIPLYDGARLARRGIIVVSVAYRVGPFGFLAHPELSGESGHGSGNYGLQDQIAGLRWVHDNISALGGDPSRVTIFGESAGAISVSMLASSPLPVASSSAPSPKAAGISHRPSWTTRAEKMRRRSRSRKRPGRRSSPASASRPLPKPERYRRSR